MKWDFQRFLFEITHELVAKKNYIKNEIKIVILRTEKWKKYDYPKN
jgi:hypothetical protein